MTRSERSMMRMAECFPEAEAAEPDPRVLRVALKALIFLTLRAARVSAKVALNSTSAISSATFSEVVRRADDKRAAGIFPSMSSSHPPNRCSELIVGYSLARRVSVRSAKGAERRQAQLWRPVRHATEKARFTKLVARFSGPCRRRECVPSAKGRGRYQRRNAPTVTEPESRNGRKRSPFEFPRVLKTER